MVGLIHKMVELWDHLVLMQEAFLLPRHSMCYVGVVLVCRDELRISQLFSCRCIASWMYMKLVVVHLTMSAAGMINILMITVVVQIKDSPHGFYIL